MEPNPEARFREVDFAELLRTELAKMLPDFQVEKGSCLLYKLHFDGNGNLCPVNFQTPTRGQLAFETDILIKKSKIPLVAIELKFGGFTIHDILTYSTKALRHKDLYPFLRYGFVVGGIKKIQNRFFVHNSGFDLAFAFMDPKNGLSRLLEIVNRQLEIADRLRKLGDTDVSSFETLIQLS
jgi:hypothetical protein